MTENRARSVSDRRALDSLKAVAFDLIPEPAMVVDREGALVAVNEAAEALFGQGLALLARGRFKAALPPSARHCLAWPGPALAPTPAATITAENRIAVLFRSRARKSRLYGAATNA